MPHRSLPPSASIHPGLIRMMSLPTPLSVPRPEALSTEPPRDCVRERACTSPEYVELVAYDWQGIMRFKAEVPIVEDLASWHVLLLRRTRKLFPPPVKLELIGREA